MYLYAAAARNEQTVRSMGIIMQYKYILFARVLNQQAFPILGLAFSMMVIIGPALECHAVTLTVNASNGSVTATPDKADYSIGEVVELKPKPNTGYYFSGWAGDARGKSLVLNLTMDSNKTITANFDTWQPPIGIPEPEFGIFETHTMYQGQTYDFGSGPEPYRDAGNGPYTHYVDNTHPSATNSGNPYGTPELPRLTIPRGLPAGSVVEVHNGADTWGYSGAVLISGFGTVERPIFVRGVNMPRLDSSMYVGQWDNTRYLIVEGISAFAGGVVGRADSVFVNSHIAVRNSDFYGDENGGGFIVAGWTAPNWLSNVVIYNNKVHDNGIWDPDLAVGDRDIGGLNVVERTNNIWIVDNEMYHNEACGLMVNSGNIRPSDLTHHIYVGRNIVHHNKQTGFGLKNAQDVIFSENIAYGHRASTSSYGDGIGYQYDPQRVWFIFNNLYNNAGGIKSGSSNIGTREDMYIIGNVIRDSEVGIEMNGRGVDAEVIVGNTIYNIDIGINNDYYNSALDMYNNLIASVNEYHISLSGGYGTAADSDISYTLFDSPARVDWGDGVARDLTDFQSTYSGECVGCIEANPLFADAASGTVQQVLDTFQTLYGIDIRKDIERIPRTDPWDIGAHETITVPNVVGLSQASAESAITSAGFTVGTIVSAYSNAVSVGSVISQDPSAGSYVAAGSSVNLVISIGAVIYVDGANGDNISGDGTDTNPYETVAKALEMAAAGP